MMRRPRLLPHGTRLFLLLCALALAGGTVAGFLWP